MEKQEKEDIIGIFFNSDFQRWHRLSVEFWPDFHFNLGFFQPNVLLDLGEEDVGRIENPLWRRIMGNWVEGVTSPLWGLASTLGDMGRAIAFRLPSRVESIVYCVNCILRVFLYAEVCSAILQFCNSACPCQSCSTLRGGEASTMSRLQQSSPNLLW